LDIPDPDFTKNITVKDFSSQDSKHFLKRIELKLNNTDAKKFRNKITWEHILPQKGGENNWKHFDSQLRQNYKDKIGNITLCLQTKNSELGVKNFVNKRKILEKKEKGMKITEDIIYVAGALPNRKLRKVWNTNSIIDRTTEYAELAPSIWLSCEKQLEKINKSRKKH
jgi:hypothetical protein